MDFILIFDAPSQNSISLLPSAPLGASLFSRYVLFHLMSGNADVTETKKLLFRRAKIKTFDFFGTTLPRVLEACPDVIEKERLRFDLGATLYPLYIDILGEPGSGFFQLGRLETFRRVTHCPNRLFFCPTCIVEDFQSYGATYWKTVHQAIFVHICPTHFHTLLERCDECGREQVSHSNWRLPTDKCCHCQQSFHGQFDSKYIVDAYVLFVKWCEDIIFDRFRVDIDQQIGADLRTLFAQDGLRSEENFLQFIEIFLHQYKVKSLNEFQELFGIRLSLNTVIKLVSEEFAEIYLVEKLVIAGALRTCISKSNEGVDQNYTEYRDYSSGVVLGSNPSASVGEIAFKIGELLGVEINFLNWIIFKLGDAVSSRKLCPWNQACDFNRLLKLINSRAVPVVQAEKKYSVEEGREEIIRLMKTGLVTRKQLYKVADTLVRNARTFDREWLDQNVPTNRITVNEEVARHRNAIKWLIKENPNLSPSKIELHARDSFQWCKRNDLKWLKKVTNRIHKVKGSNIR